MPLLTVPDPMMVPEAVSKKSTRPVGTSNADVTVAVIGSSAQFRPQEALAGVIASHGPRPLAAFLLPEAGASLRLLAEAGIAAFRTPESCADAVRTLLDWQAPRANPADDDLTAVAVYLKSLAAEASAISTASPVSFARPAAATLFVNNCGQCHGPQGNGMRAATGGGPPLRGNALVVAPDPTNVVRATVGGLSGHFGRFPMSSQLNGVTAQQLADIINYVRTSWGNDAPANVTPAMIFAMQAKTAPQ